MEDVATHEEDWKVCFAELGPGLVLFARQFVRSIADAEDIVQDAFVRFWRKQQGGGERAAPGSGVANKGLLYATVRTVALDLLRKDARRARREATASEDMEQTIEPQFDFDDGSQRELAAAIDRLPVEQREVLVMKIWNELTFAEIAAALTISQNTAASRYRYALAALKKNFVAHE